MAKKNATLKKDEYIQDYELERYLKKRYTKTSYRLDKDEFTYDVVSGMIQEQEEKHAGQKIKLRDVYRKDYVYIPSKLGKTILKYLDDNEHKFGGHSRYQERKDKLLLFVEKYINDKNTYHRNSEEKFPMIGYKIERITEYLGLSNKDEILSDFVDMGIMKYNDKYTSPYVALLLGKDSYTREYAFVYDDDDKIVKFDLSKRYKRQENITYERKNSMLNDKLKIIMENKRRQKLIDKKTKIMRSLLKTIRRKKTFKQIYGHIKDKELKKRLAKDPNYIPNNKDFPNNPTTLKMMRTIREYIITFIGLDRLELIELPKRKRKSKVSNKVSNNVVANYNNVKNYLVMPKLEDVIKEAKDMVARGEKNRYGRPYIYEPLVDYTKEEVKEESLEIINNIKSYKDIDNLKLNDEKDNDPINLARHVNNFEILLKEGMGFPIHHTRVYTRYNMMPKWIRKMVKIRYKDRVENLKEVDFTALHPNIALDIFYKAFDYKDEENTFKKLYAGDAHTKVSENLNIDRKEAKILHLSYFNDRRWCVENKKSKYVKLNRFFKDNLPMFNKMLSAIRRIDHKLMSQMLFANEAILINNLITACVKEHVPALQTFDSISVPESAYKKMKPIFDEINKKNNLTTNLS